MSKHSDNTIFFCIQCKRLLLSFSVFCYFAVNFAYSNTIGAAANDTVATLSNMPIILNLTNNDSDAESDPIAVIDVTQPAHGSAILSGGSVTYTPSNSYLGTDSFQYLGFDSGAGLVQYWGLNGNASNAVSGLHGTIIGTPTNVAGDFGVAYSFDKANPDYITASDFAYSNNFSVSFAFKIPVNPGTSWKYFFCHGSYNSANNLSIFVGETSCGTVADQDILYTSLQDVNDTFGLTTLDIDIGASGLNLIGDGLWHVYTITVSSTSGAKVYLDGVLRSSDPTRGTDSFNPGSLVYFGSRQDLNATRGYSGDLDGVTVFNNALSSNEVADLYARTNRATVNLTVCTLPVIAITNPAPASWITNANALYAGWTISPSNAITGVYFSTNGTDWGELSTSAGSGGKTNWWTNADVSSFANSTNIVYVLTSNSAGYVSTNAQTNLFEFTVPVCAITNPSGNTTISNTVTYAGTNYNSFAEITGFWYSINSGSSWLASPDTNLAWSINIDTTLYTNGPFVFGVKSSNQAELVSYDYLTNYISNYIPPMGFFVATNGDNGTGNGSFTNPYLTILYTLGVASNGSTIYVLEGTYNEELDFGGKNQISLISFPYYLNYNNTAVSISNNGALTSMIWIMDSVSNTVQGFTICNGLKEGILFEGTARWNTIAHNRIFGNADVGINIKTVLAGDNQFISNEIYNNGSGSVDKGGFYIKSYSNTYIGNLVRHNRNTGFVFKDNIDFQLLSNNIICSNVGSGIRLASAGNANSIIIDNSIFSNNIGIEVAIAGAGLLIQGNDLYRNQTAGILESGAGSLVKRNSVYSNYTTGIELINGTGGQFLSNNLFENLVYNYKINTYNNGVLSFNTNISKSSYGIFIDSSTNIFLSNNRIISNSNYGLVVTNSQDISITLNSIIKNERGILLSASNLNCFTRNNIYENTQTQINLNSGTLVATNNWWGTTIVSNIISGITTNTGSLYSFIPYRLANPFDIRPGADTSIGTVLSNLTAARYQLTNCILSNWSIPADSDFGRYSIYRSTEPSFSNLTEADIIATITDKNKTTFTNYNLAPLNYYYRITYSDDPTPPADAAFSNESWYSAALPFTINLESFISSFITNPTPNSWLDSTVVTYAGTNLASLSPITGLWWMTNSDPLVYPFAPGELTNWSTNFTMADNQTNFFYVITSNADGLLFTNVQTNYIDTTTPVVSITNPLPNEFINGIYNYAGSSSESFAPLSGLWTSTNGGVNWQAAAQTNAPWMIAVNTLQHLNGPLIFALKGSNAAGLVSEYYQTNTIYNYNPQTNSLSEASIDGYIEDNGTVFSSLVQLKIGHNDDFGDDNFYGYVAFNLTNVPLYANITNARLFVYQYSVTGDPYSSAEGPVMVDHLDYNNSLNSSDYGLDPWATNIGIISANANLEWKSLNVTPNVHYDNGLVKLWNLNGSERWSQFRLRMNETTDESDGWCSFYSSDNASLKPYLEIDYVPFSHYTIVHDSNGVINQPEEFTIYAKDFLGNTLSNYYGKVILFTSNETGEIEWDNVSGAGDFSNYGPADERASYTFSILDGGRVTLSLVNNKPETINLVAMDSQSNVFDDRSDGNLVFDDIGSIDHLKISHSGSGVQNGWVDVTVSARDSNDYVITTFTGAIVLYVSNESGDISWQNIDGNGIFNDAGGGNDSATYAFVSNDYGMVNFQIKNTFIESVNLVVCDNTSNWFDDNTDGDLVFLAAQTDLVSTASIDGDVEDDGDVRSGLTRITVGHNDGVGVDDNYYGFVAFNLSNIPIYARVTNAFLYIYQYTVTGNPYSSEEGSVVLDHLDYNNSLSSGDYNVTALSNNIGTISASSTIEWKLLDVRSFVDYDNSHTKLWNLGGATRWSQFRLRMNETTDESDGWCSFYSSDNATFKPYLKIDYVPFDHFLISHDSNAGINTPEQIEISARDVLGNNAVNFRGTVILSAANESGEIEWSLVSGGGTFVDDGPGSDLATYTFDDADLGVAVFGIVNNVAEAVNLEAVDMTSNFYDTDAEGDLVFSAPSTIDHFRLSHNGTGNQNTWLEVTVSARDVNNYIITDYSNAIILSVSNEVGEIIWRKAVGNGIFSDHGNGVDSAGYNFISNDFGVVYFQIKDSLAETINIIVLDYSSNYYDDNSEGDLTIQTTQTNTQSDASLDGDVEDDGDVRSGLTEIRVGHNDSFGDDNYYGFLAFNLTNVPLYAKITNAILNVYQYSVTGAPFGSTEGPVFVDHLDYSNTLNSSDYDLVTTNTNIGIISTDATYEWKSLEVSTYVNRDFLQNKPWIFNGSSRWSQFRLHMLESLDESDGWCTFYSGDSPTLRPYLEIDYVPLAHFVISHDSNAIMNVPESIIITVKHADGSNALTYDGTVVFSTTSASGEVEWSNLSGNGIFSNYGAGDNRASYSFDPLDSGYITLAVVDDTAESINITITEQDLSIFDQNLEGNLLFINTNATLVGITNPLPDTWLSSTSQNFSGWASNQGAGPVTGIYIGINGAGFNLGSGTSNWLTNMNLSSLSNITNVFYVIASNDVGMMTTNIQTNYVDTSPPFGEITNVTNNQILTGSNQIFAGTNYENISTIISNVLYTNGGLYLLTNTTPWQFTLDLSLFGNETVEFSLVTLNSVGLVSTNTWSNVLSNLLIALSITSPAMEADIPTLVTFAGTNQGYFSAITGFWYSSNGGSSWLPASLTNTPWSIVVDTTPYLNTNFIFGVRSSNAAGLVATIYQTNYPHPFPVSNATTGIRYTNIQAAIDAVASGETIYVYEGVYNESLTLSATNVTLESWVFVTNGNAAGVIIDSSGANDSLVMNNCVSNNIIGFTFQNAILQSISLTGVTEDNNIMNNVIRGNGTHGIYLSGTSVRNGIYSNTISNISGPATDDGGIRLEGGNSNNIMSNRIVDCANAGIAFQTGTLSNTLVEANFVSNCPVGIQLNNANIFDTIIRTNAIYSSSTAGIKILAVGSGLLVVNNTAAGGGGDGIWIQSGADILLSNNSCYNNGLAGIYSMGANLTTISNKLFSNALYGLHIENLADAYFTNIGNIIYSNSIGIFVYNSDKVWFNNNNIYHNFADGIQIDNGNSAMVGFYFRENIVYSNGAHGIANAGSDNKTSYVYYYSNQIFDNALSGINNIATDYNYYLNGNLLSGNSTGIYIPTGSEFNIISNNTIINHSADGIFIEDITGIVIKNNQIASNAIGIHKIIAGSFDLSFNNIYANNDYNISNDSSVLTATNVWWGTTISTNITNGFWSPAVIDFAPYRLAMPLNITLGADISVEERLSNLSGAVTSFSNVVLSNWTIPADGDFAEYVIYRSSDYTSSNVSPNNIITIITNKNQNSYTNISVPYGSNYYWITYRDLPTAPVGSVNTNESWYSPVCQVIVEQIKPDIIETNQNQYELLSGIIEYAGIASNNGAIGGALLIYYQTNSGPVTYLTNVSPWSLSLNTASCPDGTNVITFLAVPTNYATNSYWQTNIFDNSPPTVSITTPVAEAEITALITYEGTNQDNFSAITGFWYSSNGGFSWFPASLTNTAWSVDLDITPYLDTNVVFGVRSSNVVGLVTTLYQTNYPFPYPVSNATTGLRYTNIQLAIDAAVSGDTVYVYAGVYNESLTMTATNVTLKSWVFATNGNKEGAIIDSSGANYSLVMNNCVSNNIIGFTFQNATLQSISLTGITRDNNIINNVIRSNGSHGIYLSGNSIRTGIYSNVISNIAGVGPDDGGIRVEGGSDNNFADNIIVDCLNAGIAFNTGILSNTVIAANLISNCLTGIQINNAATYYTTLDANSIHNSSAAGLNILDAGPGLLVVNNTVADGAGNGINIQTGADILLSNNSCYNNALAGIYSIGANLTTISNNLFSNALYGLHIENLADSYFTNIGNIIYSNGIGIFVYDSDKLWFENNIIYHNSTDGIQVDNGGGGYRRILF